MSISLSSGTLYFGGKPIANGIPECSLEMEELEVEDSVPVFLPKSYEATFTTKIKRNTVLSLLYGIHVTNNWLKMHGGVMRRK